MGDNKPFRRVLKPEEVSVIARAVAKVNAYFRWMKSPVKRNGLVYIRGSQAYQRRIHKLYNCTPLRCWVRAPRHPVLAESAPEPEQTEAAANLPRPPENEDAMEEQQEAAAEAVEEEEEEWVAPYSSVERDSEPDDDEDDAVPPEASDTDRPYGDASLREGLRLWVVENGVPNRTVDRLLGHLRQCAPQLALPRNAQSFGGTMLSPFVLSKIVSISGGRMWYQSIAESLQAYYRFVQPTEDGLILDFCVNGQQLRDGTHFWTMLMKVHNVPGTPVMTVSLYSGDTAPGSAEEYLRKFVDELNELQRQGLTIRDQTYWVCLRAIIANKPARAFIKGVGDDEIDCCLKCTSVPETDGKLVYYKYETACEPRTDVLFRAKHYPGHVSHWTPLRELENCDLVLDIVVTERRQLTELGVLAQLLQLWVNGYQGIDCKLLPSQKRAISAHLERLQLPTGYERTLRDLRCVAVWTAEEHLAFLQFAGLAVLRGRMPDGVYSHFMLLFVAVTMLSTSYYKARWQMAAALLDIFVTDYAAVYSPRLVNQHVHHLLHMHEETCRFGELHTFSAYPFVPRQRDAARWMHSSGSSLSQTVHRLLELQQVEVNRRWDTACEDVPSVQTVGLDPIATIRRGFQLRRNFRDQFALTDTGAVVMYEDATNFEDSGLVVHGYTFTRQVPAFSDPFCSTEVHIYSATMDSLERHVLRDFPTSMLLCKVAAVQTEVSDEYIFVPVPGTYLA
uniref:Transposase n=1 Tax=Anopheles quadriannulatus TaxID=34691 RepID=A0A182WY64_ANOQN